jgi:NADP-dependent 3-hydroxy acid dehydrogenase YdfG
VRRSLKNAAPDSALALTLDVCDSHAVQEVVKKVYEGWGRIDVLINNVCRVVVRSGES